MYFNKLTLKGRKEEDKNLSLSEQIDPLTYPYH